MAPFFQITLTTVLSIMSQLNYLLIPFTITLIVTLLLMELSYATAYPQLVMSTFASADDAIYLSIDCHIFLD